MSAPSNYDDIIDSRDIIERIAELDFIAEFDADPLFAPQVPDEGEREEWDELRKLADECRDYSEDFEYGATLIRDSYFQEYAQELAEDIGAINTDATHGWPFNCIDWEQAARELRMDYSSVEFSGVNYWVR